MRTILSLCTGACLCAAISAPSSVLADETFGAVDLRHLIDQPVTFHSRSGDWSVFCAGLDQSECGLTYGNLLQDKDYIRIFLHRLDRSANTVEMDVIISAEMDITKPLKIALDVIRISTKLVRRPGEVDRATITIPEASSFLLDLQHSSNMEFILPLKTGTVSGTMSLKGSTRAVNEFEKQVGLAAETGEILRRYDLPESDWADKSAKAASVWAEADTGGVDTPEGLVGLAICTAKLADAEARLAACQQARADAADGDGTLELALSLFPIAIPLAQGRASDALPGWTAHKTSEDMRSSQLAEMVRLTALHENNPDVARDMNLAYWGDFGDVNAKLNLSLEQAMIAGRNARLLLSPPGLWSACRAMRQETPLSRANAQTLFDAMDRVQQARPSAESPENTCAQVADAARATISMAAAMSDADLCATLGGQTGTAANLNEALLAEAAVRGLSPARCGLSTSASAAGKGGTTTP